VIQSDRNSRILDDGIRILHLYGRLDTPVSKYGDVRGDSDDN
jgi:hypothetical protein